MLASTVLWHTLLFPQFFNEVHEFNLQVPLTPFGIHSPLVRCLLQKQPKSTCKNFAQLTALVKGVCVCAYVCISSTIRSLTYTLHWQKGLYGSITTSRCENISQSRFFYVYAWIGSIPDTQLTLKINEQMTITFTSNKQINCNCTRKTAFQQCIPKIQNIRISSFIYQYFCSLTDNQTVKK